MQFGPYEIESEIARIQLTAPDSKTLFQRALAWKAQGRHSDAILDLDAALRLNPKLTAEFDIPTYVRTHLRLGDPLPWWERAKAASKQKDYDLAIACYSRLIEIDPRDSASYNNRGVAKFDKGDKDAALSDYLKAIEFDSTNAEAHFNAGSGRKRQGKHREAVNLFRRALQLDPSLKSEAEYDLDRYLEEHSGGD